VLRSHSDGGSSGPPLSQILACRALLRKLSEEPYEHRGSLLSLTFCALLAVLLLLPYPHCRYCIYFLCSFALYLPLSTKSSSRSSLNMYISLLPAALLLSLASAQTTSYSLAATTSSACAAQPVLEACLASTEAIAAGCLSTDYSCLCQKWNDVYTYFLLSQPQSQTY
jgi:hypothetical protein